MACAPCLTPGEGSFNLEAGPSSSPSPPHHPRLHAYRHRRAQSTAEEDNHKITSLAGGISDGLLAGLWRWGGGMKSGGGRRGAADRMEEKD